MDRCSCLRDCRIYIDVPYIRVQEILRRPRKGDRKIFGFFKFSIEEKEKAQGFSWIDVTDKLWIWDNKVEAFRGS